MTVCPRSTAEVLQEISNLRADVVSLKAEVAELRRHAAECFVCTPCSECRETIYVPVAEVMGDDPFVCDDCKQRRDDG